MNKRKNSMFIVIIGFIIAVSRLLLGNLKLKYYRELVVLIIMAAVNYVALGFVFLFLNNDLCNYCELKINNPGLDTKQRKTRKKALHILSGILLFIYFVLGLLYVVFAKSANLNDAISIVALSISIAANGLVDEFGESYYKFIIFLSNINFKNVKKEQKN
ncbi:MAG: hypothetical protein HDR71_16935 [Lachnospiraceae bacterium]|nr:hypothetical protein [Lachnospiraceae bacterium]